MMKRTTYNMIYVDAKSGNSYAKRFNVKSITRDKTYHLTKGAKGSKVHYFTANPNGESELVSIQLSQGCKAKKKIFDFNFDDIAIKGRGSAGNIATKYPVRKVTQLEVGRSTLGAQKVWLDKASGRLNTDERGLFLGEFDTGDNFLALYKDGTYEVANYDLTKRFPHDEIIQVGKMRDDAVISAVYFDGNKGWTVVKRFMIETSKNNQRYSYLTDHSRSKLYFVSTAPKPVILYDVKQRGQKEKEEFELSLADFIDVKGWKSLGNKLEDIRITNVRNITKKPTDSDKLKAGDTIEFDF